MAKVIDKATQQEACRAALQATVDTLLDYDIPPAVIVESLAKMSLATINRQAVRCAQGQTSNDDEPVDQWRR